MNSSIEVSSALYLRIVMSVDTERQSGWSCHHSLFWVCIWVDDGRLAEELPCDRAPREEGVVARQERDHCSEIGSCGVAAHDEGLMDGYA